jgi:hypothetical protein
MAANIRKIKRTIMKYRLFLFLKMKRESPHNTMTAADRATKNHGVSSIIFP